MKPLPAALLLLPFLLLLTSLPNPASAQSVPSPSGVKGRTNVTLLFFFPYAIRDSDIDPPDGASIQGTFVGADTAAEMAVNALNNRTDILPDIHIHIQRVNSFDPEFGFDPWTVTSGGYSALEALKATTNGVVGAIGEYKSSTTLFSASIFSQLRIPFCGVSQGSPLLANRQDYPYFFRLTSVKGRGEHYVQLLRFFGASRVGIIAGSDTFSATVAEEVLETFRRRDIKVASNAVIQESYKPMDLDYALAVTKKSDVRYIMICGTPQLVADVYFRAKNHSLIGTDYVWFGTNAPWPDEGTITSNYGPTAGDDLRGFVHSFASSNNADAFWNLVDIWTERNAVDPAKYPLDPWSGLPPDWALGYYDCVMMLAQGLQNVMATNPTLTPEAVQRGEAQPLLTSKAFEQTGYSGASGSPIVLNEFADLTAPRIFLTLNVTSFMEVSRRYAFLRTDSLGTNYTQIGQPIFWGNSTRIPIDGSFNPLARDQTITVESVYGRTIIALEAIGLLGCLFSGILVLVFAERKVIRSASPPFLILMIIGSIFTFVSNTFFIGTPKTVDCHAQIYLQLLGFVLVFGSMIAKNLRIHKLFSHRKVSKTIFTRIEPFLILLFLLFAIEILLLILWSTLIQPTSTPFDDRVNNVLGTACMTLSPPSSLRYKALQGTLIGYNALLLLATGYLAFLTRKVSQTYNESVLMLVCVLATSLVGVIVLPSTTGGTTDLMNGNFVKGLAVWGVTMLVMVLMFGSKVVGVWWEYKVFLRVGHGKGVGARFHSEVASGKESVTSGAGLETGVKTLVHGDLGSLCVRYRDKTLLWSKWHLCITVIDSIGSKIWLTLYESEDTRIVFVIRPNTKRVVVDDSVILTTEVERGAEMGKGAVNGVHVQFETNEKATQFMAELDAYINSSLSSK
ncbi:hypothetical protein HDV05_007428 [Chytridiales sp. JEL 0842]|nr:hypothetical protein HDV05_007428 [Chytridiales sp. JEL 0842]